MSGPYSELWLLIQEIGAVLDEIKEDKHPRLNALRDALENAQDVARDGAMEEALHDDH